jgi:hypothetical protein
MPQSSSIPLTSIGAVVSYNVGTDLTTKPTTAYTKLIGLKSIPDMNPAPNTADATTFENKEYTTKVDLLKEMPDTIEFTAVLSQAMYDAWEAMVASYSVTTPIWLCIDIEGLDKSVFIPVKPISLGMPSVDVNAVVEITCRVVPLGEPKYDDDPTYVA